MKDMKWKEAIEKVLAEEKKAVHYTEIASLIAERGYRKSLGATPWDTVAAQLSNEIRTFQEKSIFVKVDTGIFILRKFLDNKESLLQEVGKDESVEKQSQFINSFGIYWNRESVDWKPSHPDLFGIQTQGATPVNFKSQIGVYLLHDVRETIYVGQAIDQPIGARLKSHLTGRLSSRWDRFSWYGIYPVHPDGKISKAITLEETTPKMIGDALEAVLIEGLEPRQNRKQGNNFSGLEYIQQESIEMQIAKQKRDLDNLFKKL
jgi:predicted GIY-YIG superfamily endonuclease